MPNLPLNNTNTVFDHVVGQNVAGESGNQCTNPLVPQDWTQPYTLNAVISINNVADDGVGFSVSTGNETVNQAYAGINLNPGDIAAGQGLIIVAGPTSGDTNPITGVDWTIPHTLTLSYDGTTYSAYWDGVLIVQQADVAADPPQAVSYLMNTLLRMDNWNLISMSATTP